MSEQHQQRRYRLLRGIVGVIALIVILTFAYGQVGFSVRELINYWPEFVTAAHDYFPTTTYFGIVPFLDFGRYWQFIDAANLFSLSVVTVSMAVGGTALGIPGALLLGTLGSERVTPFPLNFVFRALMSTIRAIPALVWALLFIPLGGVTPFTGTLAIAVDTMGYLGRLFTDELEEIESGPIEGVESTGANQRQTVFFGMLSQVFRQYIAWVLFILELNVRVAITLGLIGAGGLGYQLMIQRQTYQYTNMMAAVIVTILLVSSVEIVSQRVRARLRNDKEAPGTLEYLAGMPDRFAQSVFR
ncbi:phosphonate ABC transporter, permease protein PhnE [Halopenitus persicus]|uniref:phosphonate ABC transporter, permease protein PhnE n=1 Tax=Halopenitus persicus TaxID=1048396 RepID=UPI0015A0DBBD